MADWRLIAAEHEMRHRHGAVHHVMQQGSAAPDYKSLVQLPLLLLFLFNKSGVSCFSASSQLLLQLTSTLIHNDDETPQLYGDCRR